MKGSHNTMSYLPIRQWWLKPFRFVARCQRKTLDEQWRSGIRAYDFRIRFNGGVPTFAHGKAEFKCKDAPGAVIRSLMRRMDASGEPCAIRIIHETDKADYWQGQFFRMFCTGLEQKKPGNVVMFGGQRKCDWQHDHDFADAEPHVEQPVGSMSGTWWGAAWPWLYAKIQAPQPPKGGVEDGTQSEAPQPPKGGAEEDGIVLRDFV